MPRKKTPATAVKNTREAAIYVGLSKSTLEKMRRRTDAGPPFAYLEGSVRYRIDDLDKWLADRVRGSIRRRVRARTPGNS